MVHKRQNKVVKSLIEFPDFDKMTYEEEAKWWETHDLSQVMDKMEEIDVKFVPGAARVSKKLKRLSPNLHDK